MASPGHRLPAWLAGFINEPFVHFLVLGALIFAAYALFNPSTVERRIVVSAADVARLRELAVRQWGRAPDARQMNELVQSFVREEVLYRAALAQGLDRDDVIVRRRLAQKMEFLAHEEVRAPIEPELRQYFAANSAHFRQTASADFEQLYFSPDHGDKLAHALIALKRGEAAHGDNFMLAEKLLSQERAAVAGDFGDAFADAVFSMPIGTWLGPIPSSHGIHLLRVAQRKPEAPGRFEAVRDQVAAEMVNARVAAARDAAYASLLGSYTVVLPSQSASYSAAPGQAARP